MSTQVQLRRGSTAQHATFTGASGELTVDTDKKAAVVHDGATAGGFPLARADQIIPAVETKARVSLASGIAITESDIAGATTVYVVPAGHSMTPLWDGTKDVVKVYGALSIALDATNAPSGKNYDVWMAASGGNVVVGYGPDWTAGAVAGSSITRGQGTGSTELELFNGRLVNKNSITIRQNSTTTVVISARQANLIGGFRTNGGGFTEDSAANRLVWSVLGAPRYGKVVDTADNWVYSTAAFRQFRGSASNKFAYFQGLGGRPLTAVVMACVGSDVQVFAGVGIGVDSPSINSATQHSIYLTSLTRNEYINASYRGIPGIGYHEIWPLEKGAGSGAQTWLGDATGLIQTGMTCEIIL